MMNSKLRQSLDLNWEQLDPILLEREKWIQRPHEVNFKKALELAPQVQTQHLSFKNGQVVIGSKDELTTSQAQQLQESAKLCIPWKKGPFNLFGLEVDGEWRSDFKWDRLASHLPSLEDKLILDIGCNNGYYMFRMLEYSPRFILGIDPVVRTWAQYQLCRRFLKDSLPLEMKLLGVEHLSHMNRAFDILFSMGIIYHHPDPIGQLRLMRQALRPGGTMILETIGIPGETPVALFPQDRYAQMRNIWFFPTASCLLNWAHKAKFKSLRLIHSLPTTEHEQRTTSWCNEGAPSLKDFLHPDDPSLTIEGHPAPLRMTIIGEAP